MSGEYNAAQRERAGAAIVFELGGRQWTCRPKLPFALISNLASAAGAEDAGYRVFQAFQDLVVQSVCKEQREEFRSFLLAVPDEDEDAVTFDDVSRVATQIAEAATGSPFGSASGSPAMRSINGAMSRGAADSGASTSQPHRRVKL